MWIRSVLFLNKYKLKKYRYQAIKQKDKSKLKNPKDKTLAWNKETQMSGAT